LSVSFMFGATGRSSADSQPFWDVSHTLAEILMRIVRWFISLGQLVWWFCEYDEGWNWLRFQW
jgi:hypothetical protein